MSDGELLMTKEEVARYLRLSVERVSQLVRQRVLPHIKLGGEQAGVRFRRSEVEAWLEAHSRRPSGSPDGLPAGESADA